MPNTVPGPATGAPSTISIASANTYVQKDTAFVPGAGTQTTPTWVTYAEVAGAPGFSGSTDWTDTTSHSNPDAFKRGIPTLLAMGELNFDLHFIPTDATHNYAAGMQGDWVLRSLLHLRITYPDSATLANRSYAEFYGYVTKFEVSAPLDGVLMAKVSIHITGAPKFSA